MKPKKLTVIFDGDCILCRRSVRWLEAQRKHVALTTTAASDPETLARHGHIPGYGDNMVVVAEDGRVWVGPPDAYLVVMWAVRGMRALSYMLSLPLLKPLLAMGLRLVTNNRHLIGSVATTYCDRCVAV